MAKKRTDPRLGALLDQEHQALAEYERWYTRLKRAFGRLEKARRKVQRLGRQIRKLQSPAPAEPAPG